MNFGFLNEFLRRPIDGSDKEWFASYGIVKCNGTFGLQHLFFQRCTLKVSTHFGKVTIEIANSICQFVVDLKEQSRLHGLAGRTVFLGCHDGFVTVSNGTTRLDGSS